MQSIHRVFHGFAWLMATLGGVVLSATILVTVASILGGLTPLGPIPGEEELVQAGMAFAVFAFLPLCQITAGHATVDIFTDWLGGRALRVLQFGIEALFATVLIVIAVQLEAGMQARIRSGQTTFLLQFPVWWSYAASLAGAAAAAAVGVWTALARGWELLTNRDLIGTGEGAEQ
ncbi:TRAP transporter small permease [Rhodosalinus sp.]|uniref:TRAP transporter small permease n=1 Tax=Rhodosalinus sp. TaxID=2047741 RepID=UPI003569C0F6